MDNSLKKLIHRPPPRLTRVAGQKRREKNEHINELPSDQSDVNLEPTLADSATVNPKKWALTGAIVGSGVALAIQGLGMLSGAAAPPPPEAKVVLEQVVENTTPEILTQMEATPQMVVAGRHQEILGQGKIIKFDQFPGMHRQHLTETLEGAPNFRQVEGTDVYGVAQPTVQGIRNVLDRTGAKDKEVVWTNMREEPVVYINGRSFTVREEAHPFENSTAFKGQSGDQVENADARLKAEVLREAKENGGRFLTHGETADGSVVPQWVEINEDSVQTPREVYTQLQSEGYKVDFARIPVTDEQAPEAEDLQALVDRVKDVEDGTTLIFNCHAGRGRTTTSMVATQLIQGAKSGQTEGVDFQKLPAVREDIKEQGQYERGDYRLILSLVKNLEGGQSAKAETDSVLDRTDHIQNLRTDINKYRKRSINKADAGRREAAETRGKDYLKRYHTLINFNQYVKDQAPNGFEQSYQEWLDARPEITQQLENFELAFNQVPGVNEASTGSQYA